MEFTKEQLTDWARLHKKRAEEFLKIAPGDEYGQKDLALYEFALALLTSEPFMYAIEDEDGKPHMTEFCVSTSRSSLQDEVDAIDGEARYEDERELYKVVPVHRLPLLDDLK